MSTKAMVDPLPGHPIFQKYALDDLAARLGRSARYLLDIREGVVPARPSFRFMASRILNEPESALFNTNGGDADHPAPR